LTDVQIFTAVALRSELLMHQTVDKQGNSGGHRLFLHSSIYYGGLERRWEMEGDTENTVRNYFIYKIITQVWLSEMMFYVEAWQMYYHALTWAYRVSPYVKMVDK
jgi:hypothetical protein